MKLLNKIRSRIDSRLKSLTPERLAARRDGPRIIANSIPKSGTHLLTQSLSLFPALSYSNVHYTRGPATEHQLKKFLKQNGNGRFSAAHLWWSAENARMVEEEGFKTILMVRDPRDVVVSGVFYILKRPEHHMHRYYSSLPHLDAQISAYISGVEARHSSKHIELRDIRGMYNNYLPWAKEQTTILLRFEDLVGPKGGGDGAAQLSTIKKIATHVGASLSDDQIQYVADNTFASKSVTFRSGGSGDWRNKFTETHINEFKEVSGDLLITLGYEEDSSWR